MNKNKQRFIIGIYLAISVAIIGFLHINPIETHYKYEFNGKIYSDSYPDNDYFKYSILISIVGFIVLLSYFQLLKNNKNQE